MQSGKQHASTIGTDIDVNDCKLSNEVDGPFSVARATVKYRF